MILIISCLLLNLALIGVFPSRIYIPLPTSLEVLFARAAVQLRVCLPSQACCALHPDFMKRAGSLSTSNSCSIRPCNDNNLSQAPVRTRRRATRTIKMRWCAIPVNFVTAPPAAVLLLLATGVLRGSDVREGIVGTGGVQPISIMALFLSLVC